MQKFFLFKFYTANEDLGKISFAIQPWLWNLLFFSFKWACDYVDFVIEDFSSSEWPIIIDSWVYYP